jgi:hypothetical protein
VVSGLKGLVENRLAEQFDNKEGRFFGILRLVGVGRGRELAHRAQRYWVGAKRSRK